MVRVARIEMPACRVEAGRLAFAHGMDMKGMLSSRHTFERKLKQHSSGGLRERYRAHILAFCVLEHGLGHLGGLDRSDRRHWQDGKCAQKRSTFEKLHA